jgi:hypothetical protein
LDTAYRSFGGEVEASSTPTICRLPDSCRHQLSAIARELQLEPVLERQHERLAARLSDGAALIGAATSDRLLDGIEGGDARKRFARDRCWAVLGDVVESAAQMRPAKRERNRLASGVVGNERSARFERKTKIVPENGSDFGLGRVWTGASVETSRAKRSFPLTPCSWWLIEILGEEERYGGSGRFMNSLDVPVQIGRKSVNQFASKTTFQGCGG